MEKYNVFEDVYKEKISNLYKNADETLKGKIDSVEKDLKMEKETELREFANEHIRSYHLQDIISFEDIGLNITLSASMKSLKEETLSFIENVSKEVQLIMLEEYADEILVEYKRCHGNFAQCKLNVLERHKQIEEMKQRQDQQEQITQEENKIIENVEENVEITAPVEVDNEEVKVYQFEVKATDTQIKQLVEFMDKLGIKYE